MLTACTTETYHEICEFTLDKTLYVSINEFVGIVEEFEYLAIVLEEFDDLFVKTCKMLIMLVFARIVDGTTVEHITTTVACHIVWNTFFIGKTIDFDLKFALWSHFVELTHLS